MNDVAPGMLLGLQIVCLLVFTAAFLAAGRRTSSLRVVLMGAAFMGVVLLGVLAFISPLFG